MGKKKKSEKQGSDEAFVSLAAYLSLSRALEDDTLLRLVMEIGVGMMHVDEGSLLILDREKEELEFVMTIGEPEVEKKLKGQRFSMHKGITGLAVSSGEPQIGAPTYRGVKQADSKEGCTKEPEAVLAVPMLVEEEAIGVITAVSFEEGHTFSSNDAQLYCRFAQLCGIVIRQRRREDAVRQILLGDEDAAIAPEVKQVLAEHGLTPTDQAVVEIARDIGKLSQGREDVLPLCADLVRTVARITAELDWKVK